MSKRETAGGASSTSPCRANPVEEPHRIRTFKRSNDPQLRGVARRLGAGQVHNLGDDPGRKRSAAGLARLVAQQTMDALLGVSRLPAPDRGS